MVYILAIYALIVTLAYLNECRKNEELQEKVDKALILAIREHCKRTGREENLG